MKKFDMVFTAEDVAYVDLCLSEMRHNNEIVPGTERRFLTLERLFAEHADLGKGIHCSAMPGDACVIIMVATERHHEFINFDAPILCYEETKEVCDDRELPEHLLLQTPVAELRVEKIGLAASEAFEMEPYIMA